MPVRQTEPDPPSLGAPGEPLSGSRRQTEKQKKSLRGGAGCLALFFAVFALMGSAFLFFFLRGIGQIVAARSWSEAPCVVLSSEVRAHPGDDSPTYSIEVSYRYRFDGRDYRSDRYQFLGGSSSGTRGKQRIVDGLPPGSDCVCYVNPKNPAEAVLERGLTAGYWFTLIPLLFVLVGVGGMGFVLYGALRLDRKLAPTQRSWLPAAASPEPLVLSGGPSSVTLEPAHSPHGRFVGLLAATLVWNGIVGVFVWKWLEARAQGGVDGCLTAFLVPFVLIGLALLLGSVPYSFLALFNPRPRLSLERSSLPLGGAAELSWSFAGRPGRISRLKILAEGSEEASYRQGKSNRTEKSTFARLVVVDTQNAFQISQGRATLAIPADTMHSFAGEHSKILWTLKVEGEIARWPDVAEEVEIAVVPSRGVA